MGFEEWKAKKKGAEAFLSEVWAHVDDSAIEESGFQIAKATVTDYDEQDYKLDFYIQRLHTIQFSLNDAQVFIFPKSSGNPKELGDKVTKVLSSLDTNKKMGEHGRIYVHL